MIEMGKFLIGSQNYNLNGPNSDKDYKIIVCPSFEDFVWRENMRSYRVDENVTQWDVRHWFKQLLRGNPNALEIFYSVETDFYHTYKDFFTYFKQYVSSILRVNYGQDMINMWYGIACKTGENADFYKGLSRKHYFLNVFKYLIEHDMEMTEDTWRSEEVTDLPRKVRFYHVHDENFVNIDEVCAKAMIVPSPEDQKKVEGLKEYFLTYLRNVFMQENN